MNGQENQNFEILSIALGIFGWVESHKMGRLFRRAWGLATW